MLQSSALKSVIHSLPKQQGGDQPIITAPLVIPVSNTSELSLDKLTPFLKELKSGKPTEGVVCVCVCSVVLAGYYFRVVGGTFYQDLFITLSCVFCRDSMHAVPSNV